MWRRALLAAAVVSYLICVLVMSGMQKEDLDVSMLRKLQRYNVNFDDINNERIRQQCYSKNNDFTSDQNVNNTKTYVSTTEYKFTTTTKVPLSHVDLNMDTVLSYLKAQENSIRNFNERTTEETRHKQPEMVNPIEEHIKSQSQIDVDLLERYIQLQTPKKSFYKLKNNSETIKHDTTLNLKTNESSSYVANNVEVIDKLLKDYLSNKQKIFAPTEHPAPRYTLNIQNIYKKIDEIIANNPETNNEDEKTVTNVTYSAEHNNSKNEFISPMLVTEVIQNKPDTTGNPLFKSFFNYFSEMSQFKNNSSWIFPTRDDQVYSKDKAKTDKLLEVLNNKDQTTYRESILYKYKSGIEPNRELFTHNLVKDIAESVKKTIMKDLHNEIAGFYLNTTQSIADIISTTMKTTTDIFLPDTSKSRIGEKNMSIMDKFMDLYEQMKSLKQETFLLRPKNEATIHINDLKQQTNAHKPMFMPPVNGFQIPRSKMSIASVSDHNPKEDFKYNSYIPKKENTNRLPITIQTNSVEIQPLAIRLLKPESMIRQTIIVQTEKHLQSRNYHDLSQIKPRAKYRYSDPSTPSKHESKSYKYTPLKRYDGYHSASHPFHLVSPESQKREDIIGFRMRDKGNSRLDTDYYEKINVNNKHNFINDIQNNRNNYTPRFHERLEGIDAGSEGVVISDIEAADKQEPSVDFLSRQQTSLVDMKKGTSYDDTHFKNFLKSQQKVTDMLERILGTRPKTNTPRGVETI